MTAEQLILLNKVKVVLPPAFLPHTTDDQLLGYIDLVIGDFNLFPPLTTFTSSTTPAQYQAIVVFGCQFFAALFLQLNATLQDFTYNDNGLTVQVDQTAKIETSLARLAEVYKNMAENGKRAEIWNVGPKGIGSPKYATALGQMLKIALGNAFTWNSP